VPQIQTAGDPYYEARSFFVSFKLTVSNKSDNNLKINWNKTRYIHNGRRYGVFVFKGIKPEYIKNLTIPPDIIPAGNTFSKVISLYKLLARAPIRDGSKGKAESGIIPGIKPNGTNCILLQLRHYYQKPQVANHLHCFHLPQQPCHPISTPQYVPFRQPV